MNILEGEMPPPNYKRTKILKDCRICANYEPRNNGDGWCPIRWHIIAFPIYNAQGCVFFRDKNSCRNCVFMLPNRLCTLKQTPPCTERILRTCDNCIFYRPRIQWCLLLETHVFKPVACRSYVSTYLFEPVVPCSM